jgi:hypothetical protein
VAVWSADAEPELDEFPPPQLITNASGRNKNNAPSVLSLSMAVPSSQKFTPRWMPAFEPVGTCYRSLLTISSLYCLWV